MKQNLPHMALIQIIYNEIDNLIIIVPVVNYQLEGRSEVRFLSFAGCLLEIE